MASGERVTRAGHVLSLHGQPRMGGAVDVGVAAYQGQAPGQL
jgi:hypothetical protein